MYKNNFKHEQTGNPQYYNGTLQKIRNNNFFKLTPYLLSAVIGFSAAYNFLKTNLLEADAAELQKNLNETKSIESALTEEQAEKTTVNHKSKIEQLYNERVSQYIKDMPDIQLRSTIATLAHRRGIDTTKSPRFSILNFNDYLFGV